MGLFSKKSQKMPETARKIAEFLGCPCEFIKGGKSAAEVQRRYEELLAEANIGGYTPVIIVLDEFADRSLMFEEESVEKFRETVMNSERFDVEKWFEERLGENEEYFAFDEEIPENLKDADLTSTRFIGYRRFEDGKSEDVILAKIPVKNPWEVFAYIPFGGWNECPENAEIMRVAEYWCRKHGAMPAVISHDVLEFTARPAKDEKEAEKLAREMYIFCADIVDQGVGSVKALEKMVKTSTVWYFWWD